MFAIKDKKRYFLYKSIDFFEQLELRGFTTMDISLDALQVLDAIDRKGSFAAAASSLHRVPSAVSYSVQKLEQDLGIALFQKQGRRAIPTNAGKLLIEQGRGLLQAAEQLSLDAQQLATGWESRLPGAATTQPTEHQPLPSGCHTRYISQSASDQPGYSQPRTNALC